MIAIMREIATADEMPMMIIKILAIGGIGIILKKKCAKTVIDNRTLKAHKTRGIDKTKNRNLMSQNSTSKETIETDALQSNRIRAETMDKHLEITKNLDHKTVKMITRMFKEKKVQEELKKGNKNTVRDKVVMRGMIKDSSNRNHLKALSAIRVKGVLDQDQGLLNKNTKEMIEESKTLDKDLKGLGVGVMKGEGMIRRV